MNELLQRHGCSNVFHIPDGLRELMADISREVLREQPDQIFEFIQNYLSVLLITREHGILALKIIEDLCDCKPSVTEHLMALHMKKDFAEKLAQIIKEEIEGLRIYEGQETAKEIELMKKILQKVELDEETTASVCPIVRNAYRDYWYRKKLMEQQLKVNPDEPWEVAAQHTLELYKKTKPTFSELARATEKLQAAYKGYYIRKKMSKYIKPKKKQAPKLKLPGPPTDIAESREIDLGPVVDIKVKLDNVDDMFAAEAAKNLGMHIDPGNMLTHEDNEPLLLEDRRQSRLCASKSMLASGASATKTIAMAGGASATKTPSMKAIDDLPPLPKVKSEPLLVVDKDNDELPEPPEPIKISFGEPAAMEQKSEYSVAGPVKSQTMATPTPAPSKVTAHEEKSREALPMAVKSQEVAAAGPAGDPAAEPPPTEAEKLEAEVIKAAATADSGQENVEVAPPAGEAAGAPTPVGETAVQFLKVSKTNIFEKKRDITPPKIPVRGTSSSIAKLILKDKLPLMGSDDEDSVDTVSPDISFISSDAEDVPDHAAIGNESEGDNDDSVNEVDGL